ncbi:hypothetical protein BDF20DRAFT_970210 [Mycotypha africana]|uniref:uncharacterized protein n=1 Tax=Mycotypha africana TaxID=64632 RepID=UPI0023002C86|nr:uncharacterized protein BDF20DRAFT_970210 [Mycotypha africana]KAI8988123.1 hypothetical protein BDF20DRAFT_970210 [Mycotypha africana]
MPYTPYTLQTIVKASQVQEQASTSPTSTTLLPKRTDPNGNAPTSPTISQAQPIDNHITAVSAWETDIYCGTSKGTVLHYVVEDTASLYKALQSSSPTRLENRIHLNLGKKSVEKILLLPQVSRAVVLCDATLLFFSLPFFEPIPASFIQPIKGVFCFSHDVGEEGRIGEDGTVELVVVKRRTMQIYKIGETVHLKKEMPLSDNAITVTRYGRMVCLADHQEYKLIHLKQATVTPLTPIPRVPATSTLSGGASNSSLVPCPKVAVVKKDEFVIVNGSADNQAIGIFVNANGDAIRGTLQWSSYPQALCIEFPYTAALLSNQTIEVHNILDQTLVQTLPLDPDVQAKGMTFVHGITVWMNDIAEKLKQRPWPHERIHLQDAELDNRLRRDTARYSSASARILLYGKETVMAQTTTPFVVQADALLDKGSLEEALQLAEHTKNTLSTDSTVHTEKLRAELNYTFQKAGLLLLKQTLYEDAFSLLSNGNIDPRVVVHMFEGLSQGKWLEEYPPVLLYDGVRHVLEAIGTIKDIVNDNLKESASEPGGPTNDESQLAKDVSKMRRVLLMNARDALLDYLKKERDKWRASLSDDNEIIRTVIDTSLLKIYLSQKDDSSILELLQQSNHCSIEDCAKALTKAKRFYALSVMYKSKHMYEKVLDLWAKFYTGEMVDANFKNGLESMKELLLQDTPSKELSLSVIMQYAWWITSKNAKEGVEIFMNSPRSKEMDPDEILEKLEDDSSEGAKIYLEHLVLTKKSERPDYHTKLALNYLKDIHDYCLQSDSRSDTEALVERFKEIQKTSSSEDGSEALEAEDQTQQCTFVSYLASQQHQTDVIKLHLKLIDLLQTSGVYSPAVLFERMKQPGLLSIEEAIVRGRLGDHKEALTILVRDLQDFAGAEIYCLTNGQSVGLIPHTPTAESGSFKDKPLLPLQCDDTQHSKENFTERQALFSMLLQSYIAAPDSDVTMARSAHLLNTQGMYFDTLNVLELIPDHWPVQLFQDFIIRSLRRSTNSLDDNKIELGLSRGQNILVSSDLFKLYGVIGPIEVDNQTVCVKCHRYIGTNIFVRESQYGQLLHLHCAKLLGYVDDAGE